MSQCAAFLFCLIFLYIHLNNELNSKFALTNIWLFFLAILRMLSTLITVNILWRSSGLAVLLLIVNVFKGLFTDYSECYLLTI